MHYDFRKDIADGHKAEEEAAALLQKHFGVTADDIAFNNTKAYDLRIVSRNLSFEVKNDLMAAHTGNVAIEWECRGKPSGIAATMADYWVYKFDGVFCMIATAKLKAALCDSTSIHRCIRRGGDAGSNTKMYLVKVETFKSWGTLLD